MKTEIYQPTAENLAYCASLIAKGEIVAFPTETVYGLGANALCPESVKKIYAAKGRPSDNPLIVHIAKPEQIDFLAAAVPEKGNRSRRSYGRLENGRYPYAVVGNRPRAY